MSVQHGGNIWQFETKLLDFSASLSPLGMPQPVAEAAIRGVTDSVHYPDPDCTQLRRAISERESVPMDWIFCGNGAADLLDRLAHGLGSCHVLTLAPTFGEYERSFRSAHSRIRYFYLKAEQSFQVTEKILSFLHPDLGLLILCNPNNPTGQTIDPSLLGQILVWCAKTNTHLLLDESFLDLTDDEACWNLKPFLKEYPQLILLRSLTKSYCMPGLRLGYLLSSNQALLSKIKSGGQPWAVSIPAQYAGIAALRDCPNWPEQAKPLIQQQRTFLKNALEQLHFRVFDSQVNYLFFQVPGQTDLREKLLQQGILIRSCASFRGLGSDFYRIAVRTEEENQQLLTALSSILNERSDTAWQTPL